MDLAQLHKGNMPGNINQGTCDFLSLPYISAQEYPSSFGRTHPHCSTDKLSSTLAAETGYFKQGKSHWSPINFHKGITG